MNSFTLESVRETLSFGERWNRGVNKLAAISPADVQIATTPKYEVWSRDKVKLYRYAAQTRQRVRTPLLIVYSQIGRYSMLDLQPDRSLIRRLLAQGIDVYVIDWGNPNRTDRWIRIEDYVGDYIDGCVRHIGATAGGETVSLLGICEGGVFATCYAATKPERVANLAVAVTPIDFHADKEEPRPDQGQLNRWVRSMRAADVETMIDSAGQLSGFYMGALFQAMTPMKTLTKYNLDLPGALDVDRGQLLNFLRMESWLLDRPHHPAEAAKQLLINLYQRNELVRGEFRLDGVPVDLGRISMPVLNVFATGDHIVPAVTARRLVDHVGTRDYTELELDAGHIGVFVSRKATGVFGDTLGKWLMDRQTTPLEKAS